MTNNLLAEIPLAAIGLHLKYSNVQMMILSVSSGIMV